MAIKRLIEYLPPLLREFTEFKEICAAEQKETDNLRKSINGLADDSFFATATEAAIKRYEKILNIAPTAGQSLEDRKSTVTAKWRSVGKVDLTMFQSIADAWKNGELAVSIEDGKIKLTFVGDYGVPSDIYTLIKALGEVKPAHLPLEYNFKYLLIKEIHGVMNLTQTETQKLSKFAGGVFNE